MFFVSEMSVSDMFSNYRLKRQISIDGFLSGFEQVITYKSATYYVLNRNGFVYSYDQDWTNKSTYNLPNRECNCLKFVSGHFYITSDNKLYKTDSHFKEIFSTQEASSNDSLAKYSDINYDKNSTLLFVVSQRNKVIFVFDTNLIFIRRIYFTKGSVPFSINQFNDFIYVGCVDDKVYLFQSNINETVLISYYYFKTNCAGVSSIYFDTDGNMAITCYENNIAMLYNNKGNNQFEFEKSMITVEGPRHLAVDSLQRLVILSSHSIYIYY